MSTLTKNNSNSRVTKGGIRTGDKGRNLSRDQRRKQLNGLFLPFLYNPGYPLSDGIVHNRLVPMPPISNQKMPHSYGHRLI